MLILCPALESNASTIKTVERHSAVNIGGTKTAAKSTFSFELLLILTCVYNVLYMYVNNLRACLSMSSLIIPFLRPKTGRLLETKSKGSHLYFFQDSHVSCCI